MSATLLDHGHGAKLVTRDQLELIDAPPPTDSWYPLPHREVLTTTESMLMYSGFEVSNQRFMVGHEGLRFFGVLDIRSDVANGVSLAVGIRNSNDRTFPISFCVGNRVFCCSNLSFSSEIVISKKHTKNGRMRFNEGVGDAVNRLHQYRLVESERIERLQNKVLTYHEANSFILRAGEEGRIGWRDIPRVIEEWRQPSHQEFEPRTAYSMLNCVTEILKPRFERQPHRTAAQTIQLQQMLLEVAV